MIGLVKRRNGSNKQEDNLKTVVLLQIQMDAEPVFLTCLLWKQGLLKL